MILKYFTSWVIRSRFISGGEYRSIRICLLFKGKLIIYT